MAAGVQDAGLRRGPRLPFNAVRVGIKARQCYLACLWVLDRAGIRPSPTYRRRTPLQYRQETLFNVYEPCRIRRITRSAHLFLPVLCSSPTPQVRHWIPTKQCRGDGLPFLEQCPASGPLVWGNTRLSSSAGRLGWRHPATVSSPGTSGGAWMWIL